MLSSTLKGSSIFFCVLQIIFQILLDSLYFLIRNGQTDRVIVFPGGFFMKQQQLLQLLLSRSGCPSLMIPGVDCRNLFFLICLSPVLHLNLHFALRFTCLSSPYFNYLSFS